MKFGKTLLSASDASQDTIALDQWMDYKILKKKLKSLALVTDPALIKQGEQDFFAFFQSELKKVELKFQELFVDARTKTADFLDGPSTGDVRSDLTRCMDLHMFVLLVENYAVLNYCGFAKILKKHDKLTNRTTREKVMERAVNNLSFARMLEIRDILLRIEQRFHQLQSSRQRSASLVSKSPLHLTLQTINTGLPDRLSEFASIVADVAADVAAESNSEEAEDSQNGSMPANDAKRRRQVAAV